MTPITLDAKQVEAVELATDKSRRLVAISGPAGSGKTTIIRQVYDYWMSKHVPVALAAPTGKAARRIREATGIPAVTIHKLLEYNRPGSFDPDTGEALDPTKPNRTRANPLDETVVIVDEYAMVNYELHDNLIAALPSGGMLRAFGDVYQLPPIEEGSFRITDTKQIKDTRTPFEKLLAREGDHVQLSHVYRQEEGGNILVNADKIRRGHTPILNSDLEDFHVQLTDRPVEVLKTLINKVQLDFRSINNQVITPSKKSWVGTKQLNGILRNLLNPNPQMEFSLPRETWDKDTVYIGMGDKVVCTQNTYDLRDYFERYTEWNSDGKPYAHSYIPVPDTKMMLNGETGIVVQVYPDNSIEIDFGDRIVEIPFMYSEYWQKKDTVIDVYPLKAIDLAYALTTHKCQGSEYDTVVYIMNKSTFFAQSRQNFYTGVTRARKRAIVITDQQSLRRSLNMIRK